MSAARDSTQPILVGLPSSLLFPHDVSTVDVRRPENVVALSRMERDALVLVAALERPDVDPEERMGLVRPIGTLARLVSRTQLAGGGMRIVLQGIRRARVEDVEQHEGCLWAVPGRLEGTSLEPRRAARHLERLQLALKTLGEISPGFVGELSEMIPLYDGDAERISDLVASVLPLEYQEQARLVGEPDPLARLEMLERMLHERLLRARAEKSIDEKLAGKLRRDVLREKLEALRDELGEPGTHARELERLRETLAGLSLNPVARAAFEHELDLLRRSTPGAPSTARTQAHLEWALELPWRDPDSAQCSAGRPFERVAADLDRSHIGLEDVKRRISEILAIRRLGGGARGTVLCLIGPPGTGKSSMARAVATALDRRFLTIPVGAMTHEREFVGRSWLQEGATPGAILAGIHRTGVPDPVILLDEIDKLSLGGGGTAAGALLLLLDPDQNAEFFDHYLGAPFDLSRCLFLATANDVDEIPETLLDRMEILPFQGYTESEKYRIAREHLLPRARLHAGIEDGALSITPAALRAIIRAYTAEAGVRHLQRLLVALARKAAVDVVHGGRGLRVLKGDLLLLLGPRTVEEEVRQRRPVVGLATGLAWTSVGGTLLPIETLVMPGAGRTILTGQIGEVMRESVQTALSFVRTCLGSFGLKQDLFEEIDLHLHFPAAATPKDGPSAGIAIATAIVSLLSGRPVRHDVALTGELSLLGAVLPVGGLREKLLAAVRCGITDVVVPARNADDVLRLPEELRRAVTLHLVDDVEQALEIALQTSRSRRTRKDGPPGFLGGPRKIA